MSDASRGAVAVRALGWIAVAALGLFLPVFLPDNWLQVGALSFAAAIGAAGLMLLFGRAGQLSLGHSFFLATGAYGYIWLASPSTEDYWGLGLPSAAAIPLAVVLAALAGLLLSSITSRLTGLGLGLATLSLVFIGVWLLTSLEPLTGAYQGRSVPALVIGPFSSSGSDLAIAGLPISRTVFLWYLTLSLLLLVVLFTRQLLASRIGRAFTAIRDAPIPAAALGVEVARFRVSAFVLSSAYAGLAGVLLAVILQRVVPSNWGLALTMSYLAMVVIGGLRSVGGAVLGAAFVTVEPPLLQSYGQYIPGVGAEGAGSGIGPAVAAQLAYGALVVVVLLFRPSGLVTLLDPVRSFLIRLFDGRPRRREAVSATNP